MSSLHPRHLNAQNHAHRASAKETASKDKFVPNMKQLHAAADQLPNPEVYAQGTYSSRIIVRDKINTVEFSKEIIQRGSRKVRRWIYNGKILIRNRDCNESVPTHSVEGH